MEKELPILRVTDIIKSLADEPQWLKLLKNNGKPYQELLTILEGDELFKGATLEYKYKSKSIKGLCKRCATQLGCKSDINIISEWIRQIYDDLFALNMENPDLFVAPGEIPCALIYNDDKQPFYFTIGLPSVPHPYDILLFNFVSAYPNGGSWIVQDVEYRHYEGRGYVIIYIDKCFHNTPRYQVFANERADYLGLLPEDIKEAERYELKNTLKEIEEINKRNESQKQSRSWTDILNNKDIG